MFKKISAASAVIALLSATSLQAATPQQCIPPETAESLLTYVLPGALGALRTKCTASLPSNAALLDRKSTRLNSSHVRISYAVFCLKKKKTKHNSNDNDCSTQVYS